MGFEGYGSSKELGVEVTFVHKRCKRLNHNPPRRRKNREMKRRGNATERRGEVRRWYWVSLRVCEANLALILILGITQKFMYETVHVRDGLNRRTFSECTEGFSSSCVSEDT
ncbi:hypothetical protein ACSBR2_002402 [Camellia fascicularis]